MPSLELLFLLSFGLGGIFRIALLRERCFSFIWDGLMTFSCEIEVGILPQSKNCCSIEIWCTIYLAKEEVLPSFIATWLITAWFLLALPGVA